MKKLVAIILIVVCVGAVIGTTIVFRSNQPTFKDFEEYNDDFITVRDFILEYYFVENVAQPLIIDLNDKILSHADEKIPPVYTGAHKKVIWKITIMASVRWGW